MVIMIVNKNVEHIIIILYYNKNNLKRKLNSTLFIINIKYTNLRNYIINLFKAYIKFFIHFIKYIVYKFNSKFRIKVITF